MVLLRFLSLRILRTRFSVCQWYAQSQSVGKPNFIVIFTGDLGSGDLGVGTNMPESDAINGQSFLFVLENGGLDD